MDRGPVRFAALLLLLGFVVAGAAPCFCAAGEPVAADHCGGSRPGVRAAHDACACPCMTAGGGPAERPDVEVRVAPASAGVSIPCRAPHPVPAHAAPRAVDTSPPAPSSPPTVLRI